MTSAKNSTRANAGRTEASDPGMGLVGRASAILKRVGEPNRLQIILSLVGGEVHTGGLAEEMAQSQPAISHHLVMLRNGGIVQSRRWGRNVFYSLTDEGRRLASIAGRLVKSS